MKPQKNVFLSDPATIFRPHFESVTKNIICLIFAFLFASNFAQMDSLSLGKAQKNKVFFSGPATKALLLPLP